MLMVIFSLLSTSAISPPSNNHPNTIPWDGNPQSDADPLTFTACCPRPTEPGPSPGPRWSAVESSTVGHGRLLLAGRPARRARPVGGGAGDLRGRGTLRGPRPPRPGAARRADPRRASAPRRRGADRAGARPPPSPTPFTGHLELVGCLERLCDATDPDEQPGGHHDRTR